MRDKRRPFDELARILVRPDRDQVKMTGATTAGGNDDDNQDDAWVNPMTTEGDLIVGGDSGAAIRLGIGTIDQVLTSDGTTAEWADAGSSITSLDDIPDVNVPTPADNDVLSWDSGAGEWIALPVVAVSGQYRMYVLVSDGMGGFDFVVDGSGNLVVTLENLE